jgi:HK97 family phage portal protein
VARSAPDTRTSGSILNDAYGALTKVFGGLWSRYGGWGWSRIRLFLPSARFDWEREAGDLWMNSVVALALSWLGDRFPRPLVRVSRINRKGEFQPVGRHAATDLWQRPNRYYGRRTLEKAVGLSLKVDGNAYIYKVRDGAGRVCELWWIPHFRCLPTWPSDGSKYIDGYRVWLDTAVYHLPPEDVIHVRDGIDPRNERLGLAALRACLREACTVNFESGFTAALMKNSGTPGYAIVPDGDGPGGGPRPSREAATEMKEDFVEKFGGDRTGEPVVMAGKYKLVELGFSPEKLRLKELPQNAISRIAAAIGVAPMSLGLEDPGKTYSNLAEANRTSWGTIVAVQELVGEALRWQLLPEPIRPEGGLESPGCDPHQFLIEYDYSNVQELQESLDALAARVRENFKADIVRKNEAREELGYEPDPDGDVYFSEIRAGGAGKPDPDADADEDGGPAMAVADDAPGVKALPAPAEAPTRPAPRPPAARWRY